MSKFQCYRCGWCCGSSIDKYSSEEEFNLAREALLKLGINMQGARMENGMILWPKPCPALKFTKDGATCQIYQVRPYPCRQFLCGRQFKCDPRPFKNGQYNMEYFSNLIRTNKEFAKVKERLEDKAAEWANSHGWKLEKI